MLWILIRIEVNYIAETDENWYQILDLEIYLWISIIQVG